jgi:PST family polysaccharide transporter
VDIDIDRPAAATGTGHEPRELGAKVLRQTSAFAGLRTLSSLLTWVSLICLSRILEPRAFGAFEIGLFWIGLGTLLGDGGLAASLVREHAEPTPLHYRVVLTFALAVASALGLSFFAAAGFIGVHSGLTANEVWALRALAPLYLLQACRLIPYAKLERAIDFAQIGRIELFANLARHVTALGVALALGSVWALVASQLALAVTQASLAYIARPGWAGLGWNRAVFRSLFAYGSKVQLGNACLYVKGNLARGVLGFWLGPAAVGVFQFALGFVNVPADAVNGLARVQFPAYARLTQSDPALYGLVRSAVRGVLLVGLPILGVLVALADWAIPTIYGAHWQGAIPVVWALIPHVVADLLVMHLMTCVQGQGRAGLALVLYAAWAVGLTLFLFTCLALSHGTLSWVGMAYGAASVAIVVALVVWLSRYLGRPLARDMAAPLTAAGLGFAAAYALRASRWTTTPLWAALASALAFLALFGGTLWAAERNVVLADLRAAWRALRRR